MEEGFIKLIESAEWEHVSESAKNYIELHPDTKYVAVLDTESFGARALSSLDDPGFNRVLNFGINNPVSEQDIEGIFDFYRANNINRFMVGVSPAAKPKNINEILAGKGLIHCNNRAQLIYPLPEKIKPISSPFEVRTAHLDDRETFAYIINQAFDWKGIAGEIYASCIGCENWIHFIIFDGEEAISAAALHISGEIASLVIAGTLPHHRGKGAQKLLINYRSRKAIEAGCKYLLSQTEEDTPEKPSLSFQNMIKSGFELAYLRPNWMYEFSINRIKTIPTT